jgi:hypothetical protein
MHRKLKVEIGDKYGTGKLSYRVLNFEAFEWEWLEPLLRELLKYRRKHERSSKKS